jgi:uncharacterized protein YdhG (YjbR/CyaY superfamily)
MNSDEVKRYIEAVQDERRPLLEKLQALILGLYPDAEVVISYKIPTYKTPSGWAGLGYWKGGVSVYTNGAHNIAEFKAEYPKIKTGTGSINFKVTDEIPEPALEKVLARAMEGRK